MFFKKRFLPTNRGFYAVLHGTYKGNFFVFIKQNITSCVCFTLPDKEVLTVPLNDFSKALSSGIIEFIEKLPKKVYTTVEEEFIKINKFNGYSRAQKNNKPDKRLTSRAQNCNNTARK